ncbi:unnamed protein product [Microthlaspi erraticum]|uniref:Zinc knuckle CX2CX4HX4C domain-containing protein n=1 Tax=Microthlaspi erraticum TaxID=1685480 RepID=A0A6D2JFV0_9BRAS|nr:unnamed protein product [Microthlaspi erraticum]
MAKVQISVNALQPLVKETEVEFATGEVALVTFEFERLGLHCSICNSLAHDYLYCSKFHENRPQETAYKPQEKEKGALQERSKDVPGRALVTWTNNRRKAGKRSSIDLTIDRPPHAPTRSTAPNAPARSIPTSCTNSIDPMQSKPARSIPSVQPFDQSRQMISQPFDLLGANRLDRTTANRIEPKSTPELFRPIFSHCLGYAVFQSLHCFHCF